MSPETREEKIKRLETNGDLDPSCAHCQAWFYPDPELDPFAPQHKASANCQSGKYPHCTCGSCWD